MNDGQRSMDAYRLWAVQDPPVEEEARTFAWAMRQVCAGCRVRRRHGMYPSESLFLGPEPGNILIHTANEFGENRDVFLTYDDLEATDWEVVPDPRCVMERGAL